MTKKFDKQKKSKKASKDKSEKKPTKKSSNKNETQYTFPYPNLMVSRDKIVEHFKNEAQMEKEKESVKIEQIKK